MLKDMLENKKLFIFDMDGTLIESLGIWSEADQVFLKNVTGVSIDASKIGYIRDKFISECGSIDPYLAWVDNIRTNYNIDASLEELAAYRKKICFELIGEKLTLKPYAKELLSLLKGTGYKLCLSSSGAKSSIDRILYQIDATSFLGEDIFDLILSSSSVKMLKPSPEIHELALCHFGVDKSDAVIIEDSSVGLASARRAGIDAIIVKEVLNKDYEKLKEDADYYIDSLEYLYNIMQKITEKSPKMAK